MSDRFVGTRQSVAFPQCHNCKHYQGGLKCTAFSRIPIDIYANRFDHRQSYPGDNGIHFEPIEQGQLVNA